MDGHVAGHLQLFANSFTPMKKFVLTVVLVTGGLVANSGASQWDYTGVDNGLWNTAANWTLHGGATHQVPAIGDDAVLGLSLSVSNVTFNGTYTGAGLNSLTLDSPGHASISLNQTGVSTMIATSEYIGTTVSQNFYNQSAGTNTTTTLYLGFNNGGVGTYNLSNVGQLTAGTEFIGFAGTGGGVFAQSGGTNNVSSALVVGQTSTNLGNAYTLTGGTINLGAGAGLYVGNAGKGTFTQSAGSVNFSGASSALTIGTNAASTGNVYTLSGTGTINNPGRISVGLSGSGTFTQTGGAVTVGAFGIYPGDPGGGRRIVTSRDTVRALTTDSAGTGAGTLSTAAHPRGRQRRHRNIRDQSNGRHRECETQRPRYPRPHRRQQRHLHHRCHGRGQRAEHPDTPGGRCRDGNLHPEWWHRDDRRRRYDWTTRGIHRHLQSQLRNPQRWHKSRSRRISLSAPTATGR